jgi:predicted nuclease with RNAse H fold
MTAEVFIGVDLGTSLVRKSTGLAYIIEHNGEPWIEKRPEHVASDDVHIHAIITEMCKNSTSRLIGIDAPLSKPDHGNLRECEKRLRKHGIACYPSGAQWVKDWVEKGIELKRWSENQLDATVIEVYPYAARRSLDIGVEVKKKTRHGRKIIQEGLVALVGGLDQITQDILLSDDELDAILSAYTAYCLIKADAAKMDGKDGAIYYPLKRRDHIIDEF